MDITEPPPPPPPQATGENIVDPAPAITPQQREKDFVTQFAWRGKPIALTIASELFYRDLRVISNAPPLSGYEYTADFAAEAARVLFCAHLDAATIRQLRLQPPADLLRILDDWIEKNIALHELDLAAQTAIEINAAILRARTRPADTENIDGAGN